MLKSFPKILIIVFLAILFFQISIVEAAVCRKVLKVSINSCDQPGLDLINSNPSECANVEHEVPSCVNNPSLCYCCCDKPTPLQTPTPTPTPASKGIIFKPQVELPGYTFNSDDKSTGNIANLVRAIYNYGIGIVGILAAIVLMVGGVLWIVAGGNSSQVSEAKAWIGAALTGLILALTSYLILTTVNPALVNLQTSKIDSVAKLKTGTCTTEICEDDYTEGQCKETGGAFSQGATCPSPCCAYGLEVINTISSHPFWYCEGKNKNLTAAGCQNLAASYDLKSTDYMPNGKCEYNDGGYLMHGGYRCIAR